MQWLYPLFYSQSVVVEPALHHPSHLLATPALYILSTQRNISSERSPGSIHVVQQHIILKTFSMKKMLFWRRVG